MPILEVEIVCSQGDSLDTNWAQQIADLAANVFETGPGHTWVKLRKLERSCYAENAMPDDAVPSPVFVNVTKKEMGDVDDIRQEMKELSKGIAEVVGRPCEHVHIKFEPDAVGRIAFGGNLVEGD